MCQMFSNIVTNYVNNRFQYVKQVEINIALHLLVIIPQYPVFINSSLPASLPFPLKEKAVFFLFTL